MPLLAGMKLWTSNPAGEVFFEQALAPDLELVNRRIAPTSSSTSSRTAPPVHGKRSGANLPNLKEWCARARLDRRRH